MAEGELWRGWRRALLFHMGVRPIGSPSPPPAPETMTLGPPLLLLAMPSTELRHERVLSSSEFASMGRTWEEEAKGEEQLVRC